VDFASAQALAKSLIGGTFSAFAEPCILTNVTGWNDETQAATTETQTIKAIRQEFKAREVNGQSVQVNDYKLIAEFKPITIPVRTDSTTCSFRSEELLIVDVKNIFDSAIELQVRRL